MRTVSRPSWLLPLKRPVCRPYVVAGISVQANRVSVTSVIFTRLLRSCRARRHVVRRGAPLIRGTCSPRGQLGPERVGAALGDRASELGGPVAFTAEPGPPRPEAPRHELQRVLVGEADRAVHLVSDLRADARGLADPHLRDRDLEGGVAAIGGAERVGGRRTGR